MTDARWLYSPDEVSAPGETLIELLGERGITQKDLAARMGRPVKTINEIVKGRAQITPETAVQLERALGLPAAFWNEREAHYRGYLARVEAERRATRWFSWLDRLPLADLMRLGALPKVRLTDANRRLLLDAALKFFGVASPEDWERVYARPQAAYRRTRQQQSDRGAIAAWLRLGEIQAERCECGRFDEKRFRDTLRKMRALTVRPPEHFEPEMRRLCAEAGVVLALVPEIPRAHVSGAARWLNARPVIQLSLYGKTNDRFWFTFFHEAGHILLHGRGEVFLDDIGADGRESKFEQEANRFAAEFLIPLASEPQLATLTTEPTIRRFAQQLGIHPGIVVGRLQHEGVLSYRTPLNHLKESFRWIVQTGA
ncbi:MAG: ImmA/IrrE family metallo-endopeptidase [Betaproteobacteria bacterium]|nr:ImmA/IrrE family metallo-endopeptidase [Betaproteobacteria bacterium]